MLQAHLDLHGKLDSYRPARLSQMKHVLTDETIPKKFALPEDSSDGEEEEENFLHYRESPRIIRDEHLPDTQNRAQHLSCEFGASPVLVESDENAESDLYSSEEPRLVWLKSAIRVSQTSYRTLWALVN